MGIVTWMQDAIVWLAASLLTSWEFGIELLRGSAFIAPDVTVLPAVQRFSETSLWVVNVSFVIAVIAAGATAMTYESFQIRYGIKDLLPRLVVGFVAANSSLPICRWVLELTNSLTMALVEKNVDPWAGWAATRDRISADIRDHDIAFLTVALLAVVVPLMLSIFVSWYLRTAVLIILVGVAPLAMGCYALPQSEGGARLWWRSIIGVLAVQVLQATTLTLGTALILTPADGTADQQSIPGLPDGAEGNLLGALVVLLLTAKIPTLVGRYVMQYQPRGFLKHAAQILVVQRVTRALGGRRGTRTAPATPREGRSTGGRGEANAADDAAAPPPPLLF